ncbi:hypothetical protein PAPHI01_2245 [Pancytospora philotis]|nr:hypothetical protein PAPHI01_2245 [Pancytospora philotis]
MISWLLFGCVLAQLSQYEELYADADTDVRAAVRSLHNSSCLTDAEQALLTEMYQEWMGARLADEPDSPDTCSKPKKSESGKVLATDYMAARMLDNTSCSSLYDTVAKTIRRAYLYRKIVLMSALSERANKPVRGILCSQNREKDTKGQKRKLRFSLTESISPPTPRELLARAVRSEANTPHDFALYVLAESYDKRRDDYSPKLLTAHLSGILKMLLVFAAEHEGALDIFLLPFISLIDRNAGLAQWEDGNKTKLANAILSCIFKLGYVEGIEIFFYLNFGRKNTPRKFLCAFYAQHQLNTDSCESLEDTYSECLNYIDDKLIAFLTSDNK